MLINEGKIRIMVCCPHKQTDVWPMYFHYCIQENGIPLYSPPNICDHGNGSATCCSCVTFMLNYLWNRPLDQIQNRVYPTW